MDILIVKLSAIGDVIHTLPALNAVRRHYPHARITWLVEEAAEGLIVGHEALDRVIVSGRKRWLRELRKSPMVRKRALAEMRGFLKRLRDTRYDMVLDFQGLLKSGMLIALAKGRRKIGFGKGMEHQEHSYIFLNERIPAVDMNIHALERSLMMIEAAGIYTDGPVTYNLPITQRHRREAEALLPKKGDGPLIAINPAAKWETKLWNNQGFSRVANRLAEEWGAALVFTGGPEDESIITDIMSRMTAPAVNTAGRTSLLTLAAIYEKSDLLVTTDTGPMHLAAAVGTPVTALFGPTSPVRTGPYGHGHVVVRTGIHCSPCFKRHCDITACMNDISIEDVMESIHRALDHARP